MINRCFIPALVACHFALAGLARAEMLDGCDQIYDTERTIASCTVMIEDAGTQEPDLVTALINRGIAYQLDGEFSLALDDYDQAEAISPDDYRIYFNRPFVFGAQFLFDEQIPDLERLVELHPNSAVAFTWRGTILYLLGDLSGALHDLNRAVELDPTYPFAYASRLGVYAELGGGHSSRSDLRRFLELNPDDVLGHFFSICRPGHAASALLMTRERLSDDPDELTSLQQYLVGEGYYTGTPNGVFDARMEHALEQWLSVNCPGLTG